MDSNHDDYDDDDGDTYNVLIHFHKSSNSCAFSSLFLEANITQNVTYQIINLILF